MGFFAARWKSGPVSEHLDEWGLGGRQFGTWITWFLVGGDFYTAYTVIAVPALVYAVGAYGFFALPYTIIVYPFVFAVMPLLWKVAHANGHVTAADVVHGTYNSRGLELAVAITGMVATMPYIALQLIGMGVVIKAMGLTGELPIIAAFIILALYTYSSGLRAPALIAFVKDIMIYIVVLVAVVVVPAKLGGYGAVFAAASDAFTAKGGATGLILKPSQMLPYATLALGSALAAFMYPHTLTGIFASKSADTIRKNAILLPAYTLLLGLIALLGYMAYAANIKVTSTNDVVPIAVQGAVSGMVRRLCVFGDRDRRAGAGRGDEHRRRQPVHPQCLEILRRSRHQPCRRSGGRQDRLAGRQGRRAGVHDLPADAICARPAIARRLVDPADLSGAGVRIVHALVPRRRPAARLGRGHPLGIVDGVEQRAEAARDARSRRRQLCVLCRARRADPQYRRRRDRHRHRRAGSRPAARRYCSDPDIAGPGDVGPPRDVGRQNPGEFVRGVADRFDAERLQPGDHIRQAARSASIRPRAS